MTTTYTFQNYCKWNSTTAGTGTFTVGSAYTSDVGNPHDIPANLGVVNGSTYRYYAQSADGTQYESGSGVYSSGTLTRVTITNNSNGNTSAVNFATNPIVDMFPHPTKALDNSYVVNYIPVNKAGDTMSGNLLVSAAIGAGAIVSGTAGDISAVRTGSPTTGVIYLGNSGGRYLYFDGSAYQLGSAGTIWHTGNIAPMTSNRLAFAADVTSGPFGLSAVDTYGGAVFTGVNVTMNGDSSAIATIAFRFRYLQMLVNGTWFTAGYA